MTTSKEELERQLKQTVKATGLDLPFGNYILKKEKQYFKIVDERDR